jgi:hypothetical protein
MNFRFENEVSEKAAKYNYCIILGNANAHCACLPDFLCFDRSIARGLDLDEDFVNDFNCVEDLKRLNIPLQRLSPDSKVDATGLKLIEICQTYNFFYIKRTNRRLK